MTASRLDRHTWQETYYREFVACGWLLAKEGDVPPSIVEWVDFVDIDRLFYKKSECVRWLKDIATCSDERIVLRIVRTGTLQPSGIARFDYQKVEFGFERTTTAVSFKLAFYEAR